MSHEVMWTRQVVGEQSSCGVGLSGWQAFPPQLPFQAREREAERAEGTVVRSSCAPLLCKRCASCGSGDGGDMGWGLAGRQWQVGIEVFLSRVCFPMTF